jgi:carbonic anhydrase
MKLKIFLGAVLLLLGSIVSAGVHGHWGYSGDADPAHWGDLKPEFFMCKDGKNQSPINIDDTNIVLANGLEKIKFELKQFHFHSPSENQINGQNFPLEAHFVHQSKDGQLAVVAVMYKTGKQNTTLKKICSTIFSSMHEVHVCKLTAEDIKALLPKNKDYYRFSGSLTTPPCSEGVRWIVLKEYLEIGQAQVDKFVNVMMKGHNNRPVQPLNARKVLKNR